METLHEDVWQYPAACSHVRCSNGEEATFRELSSSTSLGNWLTMAFVCILLYLVGGVKHCFYSFMRRIRETKTDSSWSHCLCWNYVCRCVFLLLPLRGNSSIKLSVQKWGVAGMDAMTRACALLCSATADWLLRLTQTYVPLILQRTPECFIERTTCFSDN
jgi:hypothetical protein